MKKYILFGVIAVLAVSGIVISQNFLKINEQLTGYEEVPAISTTKNKTLTARIVGNSAINYQLTYGDTESLVTQSHIHFENHTNNGPIVVFLCSNLGNGPAGTQSCPESGTIAGTITADDVGAGAADRGIAAGEFDELLAAMRAGATYVNVHTTGRPGGEIRSQIDLDPGFSSRHDGHR